MGGRAFINVHSFTCAPFSGDREMRGSLVVVVVVVGGGGGVLVGKKQREAYLNKYLRKK